eukprot:PhF_6_TR4982/c0_g1_i2/m.7055
MSFRRIVRPLVVSACLYGSVTGGLIGIAFANPTELLQPDLKTGRPKFEPVNPGAWFFGGCSTVENNALSAIKQVMEFDFLTVQKGKGDGGYHGQKVWNSFHPHATWEDTVFFLETKGEIQDGWNFLASLFECKKLVVGDVMRSLENKNVLTCSVEFEYRLRGYVPLRIAFPAQVFVQIDKSRIRAVRVHWFKGVLLSQTTLPMWGCVGDGFRKTNGFLLGSLLRTHENVSVRVGDIVSKSFSA